MTPSLSNSKEMQHRPSCERRRRRRLPSSSSAPPLRSAVLAIALFLSPCLLVALLRHESSFLPSSNASLRMNPFSAFQIYAVDAKEIVATHEWQLLGENDTVPAGLHIKMDLSTGEKWAKIATDESRDESIKAAAHDDASGGSGGEKIQQVEMDASGALSIVETASDTEDQNNSNNGNKNNVEDTLDEGLTEITDPATIHKDYEMMHRVMSNLPPEELERFGGLPALPFAANSTDDAATPSGAPTLSKLTPEQRQAFEKRMEDLWQLRQKELAKFQGESVADLPSILKDRILMIEEYLNDTESGLRRMVEDKRQADDDDEGTVANVIDALQDLEYQLADVDMARDFHTLGGWPCLVALLDDRMHGVNSDTAEEDHLIVVDEVRALAAMTVGTAVSNLGEFRGWATEDVTPAIAARFSKELANDGAPASALSVLMHSFEKELYRRARDMAGGTTAVPDGSAARYRARATYRLRAVYALGSLMRGNPAAQRLFVSGDGPETLARDVLGTLSTVRGPSAGKDAAAARLDYRLASKVLALGEDVVVGVVLHQEDYADDDEGSATTAGELVGAFTTERWCDLALRMLVPPSETIGTTTSRGIKERALSAVRALAPGCQQKRSEGEDAAPWGVEEVKSVRSEWNREGSDDGLDSVYRRELLDVVDGVLGVLQEE